MKYRVVLEVLFNDGTADKVAMYSYESKDSALKGFYGYMNAYTDSANVKSVNALIKDSLGGIYNNEKWVNPNPTVVNEETVTE